jgi:CRISPR-associated protein Cas2
MKWVIAYDIALDSVRERVARILLRHGERVQESVFECRLDDREIALITAMLGRELGDSEGNIRFYRLCRTCQPGAFGIGAVRKAAEDGAWIVVGE